MGLVKEYRYEASRKPNLIQKDLEEIILDTEITLNNQPLIYIDDEIQYPILKLDSYIPKKKTFLFPAIKAL